MIEEEEESRDTNVLDSQTGHPRLCQTMCASCIYRPGNLMHLRTGRLKDITDEALEANTFVVCHSTLSGPQNPTHVAPAVCRGFYDNFGYRSNLLRIYGRLGGFTEIDPNP